MSAFSKEFVLGDTLENIANLARQLNERAGDGDTKVFDPRSFEDVQEGFLAILNVLKTSGAQTAATATLSASLYMLGVLGVDLLEAARHTEDCLKQRFNSLPAKT